MPASILIVEDEIIVALQMAAIVDDIGYTPLGIAPDAESARQLAKLKPDLALVDLHLRDGLTGIQVGEYLASQGVPVIFMTANPRMVEKGVKGALGVLGKPVEDDALVAVIKFAVASQPYAASPPNALTLFR